MCPRVFWNSRHRVWCFLWTKRSRNVPLILPCTPKFQAERLLVQKRKNRLFQQDTNFVMGCTKFISKVDIMMGSTAWRCFTCRLGGTDESRSYGHAAGVPSFLPLRRVCKSLSARKIEKHHWILFIRIVKAIFEKWTSVTPQDIFSRIARR